MIAQIISAIGSALAWFVSKFGITLVRSNMYLGVVLVSWSIYLVSLGFAIYFLLSFINLVKLAFTLLSSFSSSGGCVGSAVSSALSCSGVIQGFNAGLPYLSSSIVFLILVFVHNGTQNIRTKLTDYIYQYVNLTK